MSSALADRIREHLHQVALLRAAHQADAALGQRVHALKAYQARRFEATYADLLAQPRYRAATRFFLEELYGPQEFAERDAQFGRVVPALVRLFPHEVVATVEKLGQLHALSESLDDATARHLPASPTSPASPTAPTSPESPGDAGPPPGAARYVQAWQATGRAAEREQQIALTQAIGQSLDRLTRSRLMRSSLRLMRGPAQAAGLGDLQRFLESGFEAFGAMKGAEAFLGWVGERERALAAALFAPGALAAVQQRPGAGPLDQLPA